MTDEVKQIISAYVLGCLDNKNLSQFVDYVHHGGKEIDGQLGELQNIVSLVPTLLISETPPELIKDEVAQKILESEFETREIKSKEIPQKDAEAINLEHQPLYDNSPNSEPVQQPEVKSKKGMFIYTVLIFLLLALLTWGVYGYFANSDFRNRNTALTKKLGRLNEELKAIKKISNENLILIDFISNENLRIVEFLGADTIKAKGKMFISFNNGEAVLTFSINGELSSDEYLKLWAVLKRNEVFLGEINYSPLKRFYKIDKMPAIAESEIKLFSITIEKRRVVDTLPKRILMTGRLH